MIFYPSPNFEDRPKNAKIAYIIVHYTEMDSAQEALTRLCDPSSKVSAHFLISKDGAVYQLVDPLKRAWHAGLSFWGGDSNLNDISIGIELDHPGHKNPEPYWPDQIRSLHKLLKELCSDYAINPENILGHSDIAPDRKIDPGEFFDWEALYHNGFGAWFDETYVEQEEISLEKALKRLQSIGYKGAIENIDILLFAFQRHFYPKNVTGSLDCETFRRMGAFLWKKREIE